MVTVNMWIWGAGPLAKEFIEREINAFNRNIPDVQVEVSLISWRDAWESIVKAANEQKGPDILQIGSTWNATLADLGVLKDITQEVSDAGLMGEVFAPAAWTSCRFPKVGGLSSLPWFLDIRAIYYRQDILGKLGMSADNLVDWTSFDEACENIKGYKKDGKEIGVFGVSGQGDAMLLQNIAPWLWGAGGDFLTSDGRQAAFNEKEALNGIEFYISLISKGYIPLSALKLKTEDINIGFFSKKGDYAIAAPGPLDPGLLDPTNPLYSAEVSENCMSSCFPAGPAGRFVFCGGSNLAITSFAQHPRGAWEFIKFLTSRESQSSYPLLLNMFPSLLESFEAVFMEDIPRLRGLKNAWEYGRAFPNVAAWGAIESLLVESFGRIFARAQEGIYDMFLVRQDLDRAALDVNDLLAR